MAGKYKWTQFRDVNLEDSFFNTLKKDYPEFTNWFERKSIAGESALVFNDEFGIGAFVYLKEENEPIELTNQILPAVPRLKIGTLRLAERFRGLRLGEGALGVALWRWQFKHLKEIYVTVFQKHILLIHLFEKFGFKKVGINKRGEYVYLKKRNEISYLNSYTSFPFINPNFKTAGIIPIYDKYHDRLFPYSELKGNNYEVEEEAAGNGVTKIFIATPFSSTKYEVGEPVCIYRIHTGNGSKTYKSVITSFCTITNSTVIKERGQCRLKINDFINKSGNKTIYKPEQLINIYNNESNIIMLELIYNGYFGKGHNIIHKELKDKGLFSCHPYNINYTKDQFIKILEMGDVNVQNVIIHSSKTRG